MSPVNNFSAEGTTNAPAVELLRLNTLRGTKTAFLSSKRSSLGTKDWLGRLK